MVGPDFLIMFLNFKPLKIKKKNGWSAIGLKYLKKLWLTFYRLKLKIK